VPQSKTLAELCEMSREAYSGVQASGDIRRLARLCELGDESQWKPEITPALLHLAAETIIRNADIPDSSVKRRFITKLMDLRGAPQ
jgi:hypothetical protein